MSKPELFNLPLTRETLERLARESFDDMVKFVIDIERQVICVGGGLHADEEAMLLENGSQQKDLWGANYYLQDSSESRFEYTSMINIRPSDENTKQEIQSDAIRTKVRTAAIHFFEGKS
jgi:hypothetical protein